MARFVSAALCVFAVSALNGNLLADVALWNQRGKGNAEFAESQRGAEKSEPKLHELKPSLDDQAL